jgi:glycosyltransferase involved in cell wall biosynthesis
LRNEKPCELCFYEKNKVLKYNCVKNSRIGSLLGYLESLKWNKKDLEKYTSTFICPSEFMKGKMISGGFDAKKLKVLCNFTAVKKNATEDFKKDNYYCYVGRLSKEKGVETLLKAAQQHPYPLRIAGNGPLFDDLKEKYESEKISFLGHVDREKIKDLMGKAMFTVIPSEWYENNPLSVIESLCLGTPVLGSNIGGIPELMRKHELNMTFQMGDIADLKRKIEFMWNRKIEETSYKELAMFAQNLFSEQIYYEKTMELYAGNKC